MFTNTIYGYNNNNGKKKLKNIEKSFERILFNSKTLVDKSRNDKYRGGTSDTVDVDELIRYSNLIATIIETEDKKLFIPPCPPQHEIVTGILYSASGIEPTNEVQNEEINEPTYDYTEGGIVNMNEPTEEEKPAENFGVDDFVWD